MIKEQDTPQEKEQGPDMLKAAATIIGGILLALTLWLGDSVSGNTISLAQMSVKLDQLLRTQAEAREQVREAMAEAQDRHTQSIARLDGHLETIWPRLREMKERVQYLESLSGSDRAQEKWQY